MWFVQTSLNNIDKSAQLHRMKIFREVVCRSFIRFHVSACAQNKHRRKPSTMSHWSDQINMKPPEELSLPDKLTAVHQCLHVFMISRFCAAKVN